MDLMKVAIPVFGSRVSPRFDCAPGLVLYTLGNGKIMRREELSLTPFESWQRVEKLKELKVQSLICGGIERHTEGVLRNLQIQVISWIAGEAQEILQRFLRGSLRSGTIPGRCPGRHR